MCACVILRRAFECVRFVVPCVCVCIYLHVCVCACVCVCVRCFLLLSEGRAEPGDRAELSRATGVENEIITTHNASLTARQYQREQ